MDLARWNGGDGTVALIFFVGAAAFVVWLLSMSMDRRRIEDYVRRRKGRVISIAWAPFGRGWFGERNDRIYEVIYYDAAGKQHFATCKTSMFSGVYWTEDRVSHRKADWYGSLPPTNEPGNSLIKTLPPDDGSAVAGADAGDE